VTAAALLLLAAAAGVPAEVTIATPRGERRLPVRAEAGAAPSVAAAALAEALGGVLRREGAWAEFGVERRVIRLLLDAALVVADDAVYPLSAATRMVGDSVFVSLQLVADVLPRVLDGQARYDLARARLVVTPAAVAAAPAATPARPAAPAVERLPNGLRRGHVVAIDPGHGGVDPGNPGLFFPRGVREKDVTLAVGLLLRDELARRGVGTRMTRATDTLIDLRDRGGYCSATCDLFVSLHVNSLPKRRGYTAARGFETYFLAEAKTEDALRVARMENEAIRFETVKEDEAPADGLDFILKDLQLNEHLRESARAAELVQERLEAVHSGPNRGVKQAGFMVLTTARRPAILVELGYSTNPEDARVLAEPASQRRLARALADAIVGYLLEYERRAGIGVDSVTP